MAKMWTVADQAFLKEKAGELHVDEIGATLKRTRSAVVSKANELGISLRFSLAPADSTKRRWADWEIDLAVKCAVEGGDRSSVAESTGRSIGAVSKKIEELRKISE